MVGEFVKVTERIHYFSGEEETDRPFLYYVKGRDVTIHGRCEKIISYYPSIVFAFADRIQNLGKFFARNM